MSPVEERKRAKRRATRQAIGRPSVVLGRRGSVDEYFWVKVAKTESCWEWLGGRNESGYGNFGKGRAHRWAYERFVGPIPAGLQIDHLCGNRLCVNPAHMEPVTQQENIRRYYAAKRWANACT